MKKIIIFFLLIFSFSSYAELKCPYATFMTDSDVSYYFKHWNGCETVEGSFSILSASSITDYYAFESIKTIEGKLWVKTINSNQVFNHFNHLEFVNELSFNGNSGEISGFKNLKNVNVLRLGQPYTTHNTYVDYNSLIISLDSENTHVKKLEWTINNRDQNELIDLS
ncbi:MAG: hypothetical protein HAW67_07390, partial [Endozoicomonadaceae bacterium]|nr:hypothetical protein [Endozoicomonadaceae bacterium]